MTSKFKFDGEAVRKLAEILTETGLTEIEYEADGNRIYVSRQITTAATVAAPTLPAALSIDNQPTPSTNTTNDLQQHPGVVKSPMVGTAYLSPEPGAAQFVKIGDTVSVGQTLLIIEAMKVMNPITATKAGKVIHIFVKDATPVEYDEPLLVIE
jgi:acetyl-CoA carboxylase biotin carboxyl carrier protein